MIRRHLMAAAIMLMSMVLTAQGKRVLFIGDSITDGAWGNGKVWNATSDERSHTDMNHIYGHGYMMLTAAYYEALYPEEGWHFWNRGISGNTLDDLTARWQKDVLDLQPDVVSILIGTNDVQQALNEGRSIAPEAWGNRLRSLLDQVLAQNAEARFVLCTPFVAQAGRIGESSDYATRAQMIAELGQTIRQLSDEYQAVLVPFDTLVSQTIASTPQLPATYWIWDGIHPTPAMHYRMAELWRQKALLK